MLRKPIKKETRNIVPDELRVSVIYPVAYVKETNKKRDTEQIE